MSLRDRETKVYLSELPSDASAEDIERQFSKYGRILSVWLTHNPSGSAFIQFVDFRDAEDAVAAMGEW